MSRRGTTILRTALSALHYSGIDGLLAPLTRGSGAIFTLHHVLPAQPRDFAPNRILEVTPEFLEGVIRLVLDRGFDVLSMDEVHYRLSEGDLDRPFVSFTLDDGYRDNLKGAYPVFRHFGLPFTVYIATDLADGSGDLWWLALEKVIAATGSIEIKMDGAFRRFSCALPHEKDRAFHAIYWWLRRIPEGEARRTVGELCRTHGVDVSRLCRELVMTWDEIRDLARDPLVTIGAHTRGHLALAGLGIGDAHLEMAESIARIEAELGRPCRHFSYPYGDPGSAGAREFRLARELGLKTAVTTRKGLIKPEHSANLTGLPRVSLNGDFQDPRYVKVLLTGAPFALLDMAGRLRPRSSAGEATP